MPACACACVGVCMSMIETRKVVLEYNRLTEM